jgi:hypothetical protein
MLKRENYDGKLMGSLSARRSYDAAFPLDCQQQASNGGLHAGGLHAGALHAGVRSIWVWSASKKLSDTEQRPPNYCDDFQVVFKPMSFVMTSSLQFLRSGFRTSTEALYSRTLPRHDYFASGKLSGVIYSLLFMRSVSPLDLEACSACDGRLPVLYTVGVSPRPRVRE